MLRRREVLLAAVALFVGATRGLARSIVSRLPWSPNAGDPPAPVQPGPWRYFTAAEGATVEAIADRIVPPDPDTPGGKDAGCAVFVDRQLAGPYGRQQGLYREGPFQNGARNQGPQSQAGPAQKYRDALAALQRLCADRFAGRSFVALTAAEQDAMLHGLESGDLKLDGADGQDFMEQAVKDVQMGFFADPVYGGNRDMVAWKMIGYPGARYNYLDWVTRHNERFPLPPVGITGRAEWQPRAR